MKLLIVLSGKNGSSNALHSLFKARRARVTTAGKMGFPQVGNYCDVIMPGITVLMPGGENVDIGNDLSML